MAQSIDRKARRAAGSNALITLVATVGILVLVHFFVSPRVFGRVDLTHKSVHTLHDASRAIVGDLEGLTVRVFISNPLPPTTKRGYRVVSLRGVDREFRDRLEEYRAHSNGNMTLTTVTENIIEEAEKARLELFTSDEARVASGGTLQFDRFALGATFHYKNVKEVYGLAVDPTRFEHDITSLLFRLKEKHAKSLLMADVLSDGKTIFEAVKSCHDAIQTTMERSETEDGGSGQLKALLDAAERQSADLEALVAARETRITPACKAVGDVLTAKAPTLRAHQNVYLDTLLGRIEGFIQLYQSFDSALASSDPGQQMAAFQSGELIRQVFTEVDRDHENLVNSPGQKRIGIVCGHGEFCPFPRSRPFVDPNIGRMLGQQNPMVQQFMGQASQIEQKINQINDGHNNLFRRWMGFDIARIDLMDPVADDIESLLVMGPTKTLADRELYHLDQFALRGKSLVVFTRNWDVSLLNLEPPETFGEDPKTDKFALMENASNIDKLLAHYGVEVHRDLIMEPQSHEAILLTELRRMPTGQLMPMGSGIAPYPMLPTFTDVHAENPLMLNVDSLTLPYASTLSVTEAASTRPDFKATPLVHTSDKAVVRSAGELTQVPLLPPENARMMQHAEPTGRAVVAMQAQGAAKSFFEGAEIPPPPAGATPPDEATAEEPERLESGNVRLLVVGSSLGLEAINVEDVLSGFSMDKLTGAGAGGGMDFLLDLQAFNARFAHWQIRMGQIGEIVNANIPFLRDSLDWSVKNDELVAIRGKVYSRRPISRVNAGTEQFLRFANLLGVPLLFLGLGGVHLVVRRRRQQALRAPAISKD